MGNYDEKNCNILIEEADFNRHNGTWTCVVNRAYADTVNVTVTDCEFTWLLCFMVKSIWATKQWGLLKYRSV